jgi:hypothetical protein
VSRIAVPAGDLQPVLDGADPELKAEVHRDALGLTMTHRHVDNVVEVTASPLPKVRVG